MSLPHMACMFFSGWRVDYMLTKRREATIARRMILLVVVLFGAVCSGAALQHPAYDEHLSLAFVGTRDDADCIVLWRNDFAMMIDTGEEQDAQEILRFLAEEGIHSLDYLVLTHPDKDHIGSVSAIMEDLEVDTVVQSYYRKENNDYQRLQTLIMQEQCRIVMPRQNIRYQFHDLRIDIFPPEEKHYQNDNDYSLAVLVQHKNVGMLFPGDAEGDRVEELMNINWPGIQLYKLPHHGRYGSHSADFLETLRPSYAVVTAQEADGRMLETNGAEQIKWFYTVERTIRFLSDGEELSRIPLDLDVLPLPTSKAREFRLR